MTAQKAQESRKNANAITLFSVGIAGVSREVEVPASGGKVSLACRSEYLADMLDSLVIQGAVRETSPASFRSANENQTELSIDADSPLESVVKRLSGQSANITAAGASYTGVTILGVERDEQNHGGYKTTARSLVFSGPNGLARVKVESVTALKYTDQAVQAEFDKAVKNAANGLKSDSTVIELALTPDADTGKAETVVLHYSLPAPVPMPTYRLIKDGDSVGLAGLAVIHNNTDEDWRDTVFSVVYGAPLTYKSHTGDRHIPQRPEINLSPKQVAGGYLTESGFEMCDDSGGGLESVSARGMLRQASCKGASLASAAYAAPIGGNMARGNQAASREVGDFCQITTEEPQTILANRSGLVSLFNVQLKEAATVLLYDADENPTRPMRAFRFRNDTSYSLPVGSCFVYDDGLPAGKTVMPDTKQGSFAIATYAVENSVRAKREVTRHDQWVSEIRFSEGTAYYARTTRRTTTYTFQNSSGKPSRVMIDHKRATGQYKHELSNGATVIEELNDGVRLQFQLTESRSPQTVSITEVQVTEESVAASWGWIHSTIIAGNNPLMNEKAIKDLAAIRRAIETIETQIQAEGEKITNAEAEQRRVVPLYKEFKDGEDGAQYRKAAAAAEATITTGKAKVSELNAQKRAKEQESRDAIRNLTNKWTGAGKPAEQVG